MQASNNCIIRTVTCKFIGYGLNFGYGINSINGYPLRLGDGRVEFTRSRFLTVIFVVINHHWGDGGIGRRSGLKIRRLRDCVGSTPTRPTKYFQVKLSSSQESIFLR